MRKLAMVRTHRLDDEGEQDTFPIVKGIPIPTKQTGQPMSKMGKTMRALQVGDSFMMRSTTKGVAGIHKMAERIGIEVETRRVGDGWRRVWRTK